MRVLIGGDSYATEGDTSWPNNLRHNLHTRHPGVGLERIIRTVATGGSSIDHGLFGVESALQANQYSHIIASITHPHRFWHRAILDRPWLASRYAEPRIQGFLREFADLPDWADRQNRCAIRNYHSFSRHNTRVAVLLPFADEMDIPRWRQLGLIPQDDEGFWIVPLNINGIRLAHNSDEQRNHLPESCKLNMATLFTGWIEHNSRDMSVFGEMVYTW